jgi:hypothetical protein
MKGKKFSHSTTPLAVFIVTLMLAGTVLASGPKETVLHRFPGGGDDGLSPYGRLISDAAAISMARPLSVARREQASFSS